MSLWGIIYDVGDICKRKEHGNAVPFGKFFFAAVEIGAPLSYNRVREM
jgi:hypothetical protein